MGTMLPTPQLRWNRRPDTEQNRLEQLWIEVVPEYDDALGGKYTVLEPDKEWRPLQLVKIGWKNDEYGKPLPHVEP